MIPSMTDAPGENISEERHQRAHPDFPRLGVGILVFKQERCLLILRGQEPHKGKWTLPGGLVQVGETLAQAAARELYEECGIRAQLLSGPHLFEFIQNEAGGTLFHFVIADFIGKYLEGELRAASDAADAAWIDLEALNQMQLTPGAGEFIREAHARRSKAEPVR